MVSFVRATLYNVTSTGLACTRRRGVHARVLKVRTSSLCAVIGSAALTRVAY